jgi:glycosyltransferase involved in cell wall biosynthesis
MPASEDESPILSVVMPAFNERPTILEAVDAVLAAPVESLEVLVVDDGSTDGTAERLATLNDRRVRVLRHDTNRGKGAALRSAFPETRGRFVLVQDADLEYDPQDYPVLLRPLLDGHADVVFGSRFLGGPHRVLYFWHSIANKMLTLASNMVTDLNLTDMETGYKAFRRDRLIEISLEEDRFGIEPEITAKVAEMKLRVWEVPVRYRGRTYAEGKKIGLKDAARAGYCIVRYGAHGWLQRLRTNRQD